MVMADQSAKKLSEEILLLPFLVVESNPALQKSIVSTLTAAGVKKCGAVANGVEAWQIWKQSRDIGVFIAAWNLPEMPGLEILKRIRRDKLARMQPAFIIMASEDTSNAVQMAVDAGADCFLAKPFPAGNLIPMVVEGVEHRKQISGDDVFAQKALEAKILQSRVVTELIFERYTSSVECEEMTVKKCVIRVENNYGLGTVLNLRFARQKPGTDKFYLPLKGTITKIERVPKEYGWYKVHIQYNGPVKERHGIKDLLEAAHPSGGQPG